MIINNDPNHIPHGHKATQLSPEKTMYIEDSVRDSYYCNNFDVYFVSIGSYLPKPYDLSILVPEEIIQKVCNKELMLGFEFFLESHNVLIDSIYHTIVKHDWPECQILLIQPGGESCRDYIINTANQLGKEPIKYECFNSVEKISKIKFLEEFCVPKGTIPNLKSPLLKDNHSKKFINLNFTPRDHRTALAIGLKEKNLLQHGYVSIRGYETEGWWEKEHKHICDEFDVGHNQIEFGKELPMILDLNPKANIRWPAFSSKSLFKYYQDTYLSLVTETWWHQGYIFHCTEKIFKAVFYKHPFIVASTRGFLQYFRQMGYKTFDGIIDENYDLENDSDKRMHRILNEIERICSFNDQQLREFKEKCLPIIEHNYQVYMTKTNYITKMI